MYLDGDDHASHMKYSINFTTKLFKAQNCTIFLFLLSFCTFFRLSKRSSLFFPRLSQKGRKKLIKFFLLCILECNSHSKLKPIFLIVFHFHSSFFFRSSLLFFLLRVFLSKRFIILD